MTGDEFKAIIKRLGFSQVGAARFIRHDGSTVRRWIAGKFPVPYTVELLLLVMDRYHLTPDKVLSLVKGKHD